MDTTNDVTRDKGSAYERNKKRRDKKKSRRQKNKPVTTTTNVATELPIIDTDGSIKRLRDERDAISLESQYSPVEYLLCRFKVSSEYELDGKKIESRHIALNDLIPITTGDLEQNGEDARRLFDPAEIMMFKDLKLFENESDVVKTLCETDAPRDPKTAWIVIDSVASNIRDFKTKTKYVVKGIEYSSTFKACKNVHETEIFLDDTPTTDMDTENETKVPEEEEHEYEETGYREEIPHNLAQAIINATPANLGRAIIEASVSHLTASQIN